MSLYNKIIIFMILTFLSCLAIGYYLWFQEKTILANFTKIQQHEDINNFNKLIKINTKNINMLAKDYSYWDEMVNFLDNHDYEWANKNIDQALNDFDCDYIYIINKNFEKIYEAKKEQAFKPILESIDLKKISLNTPKFYEFFINNRSDPVQVVIAPIQPSGDFERITPPKGFVVVGMIWDKKFIDDLSKTTDSEISVIKGDNPLPSFIGFIYKLQDLNEKIIYQVKVLKKDNLILHFEDFAKKDQL